MAEAHGGYYVPHGSHWPIIGSIGLATLLVGFAALLNGSGTGTTIMIVGAIITLLMMFGWFGTVIRESEGGMYNEQVDQSFRWGMGWFIFSEVMFFAAFFGALFYARQYSVPWIGGEGAKGDLMRYIWQGFEAHWPLTAPPDTKVYDEAHHPMGAWGLPAINTAILLASSVTVTIAHWGLKANKRAQLVWWLLVTVVLGFIFLYFQATEYAHAYSELNLKLSTGIYGSTFFMLTGFHGLHVTIGAIMLLVMLLRSLAGHFSPEHHFAFEAASWYWHFVDVVWLGLFTFVYWL